MFDLKRDYTGFDSGIWHSSSGDLPQTEQSPKLSFNIGLLEAQVPLNSFPVKICLILIRIKDIPKVPPMIKNTYRN